MDWNTSEFDWAKYIDLAQQLDKLAGEEEDPQKRQALYRASISHAYYGAYCLARNRLKLEVNVVSKCGRSVASGQHYSAEGCLRDHGCVAHYYEQGPNQTWQLIGQKLRTMYRTRKMADYDDLPSNRLDDKSREQLWDAQDIARDLQKL